MRINGVTALVTGANRGIGEALTEALLAGGAAKVYAAARDPAAVRNTAVEAVALDITDDAAVAAAASRCGDVALLINNAGIAAFQPLIEAPSMEAAQAEIETNYLGTLRMCRAFAPVLKRNGGGVLANILSVVSWFNAPMQGSYCASKAAAWSMTQGIRHELKAQGTRVVGVHFGYVETDMTAHLAGPKEKPADIAGRILQGIEAGEEEIVADERARSVRAALARDLRAMEGAMQAAWDGRGRN